MAEALPAASRPARAAGPATLWRHPDFLKLWSAQTISVFGDNFTALALPLLAAITWAAHTLVPPRGGAWSTGSAWRVPRRSTDLRRPDALCYHGR